MPAQRPASREPISSLSRRSLLSGALASAGAALCGPLDAAGASYALAMHGAPAWPPNFTHPVYARSDAPKGGRLVIGLLGSFDSLNPFIVRGLSAQSLRGHVFESLLARGYDEPFTLYALLAKGVETNDERSFVTFTIDPTARFSDGEPVKPQDVVFSWQLLRDHGRPNYRTYYIKAAKTEIVGKDTVRFDLSGRAVSRRFCAAIRPSRQRNSGRMIAICP